MHARLECAGEGNLKKIDKLRLITKVTHTLIAETGKNHVIFTYFSRRALRLFYVMKLRLHDYVAAPSYVVSGTSYIYVILTSDWSGKYVLSTF